MRNLDMLHVHKDYDVLFTAGNAHVSMVYHNLVGEMQVQGLSELGEKGPVEEELQASLDRVVEVESQGEPDTAEGVYGAVLKGSDIVLRYKKVNRRQMELTTGQILGLCAAAFVMLVAFLFNSWFDFIQKFESVSPDWNPDIQLEMLTLLTKTFDDVGVRHHLDLDSMVQMMRDKRFADHDIRMDMSVFAEDIGTVVNEAIPRLVRDYGFKVLGYGFGARRTEGMQRFIQRDLTKISVISLISKGNCIDLMVKTWIPELERHTFGESDTFWAPKVPEHHYLYAIYMKQKHEPLYARRHPHL